MAEQMEISRLRAELARSEDGARPSLGKATAYFGKGPEVKYAFIERHRHLWPICVQCRSAQVRAIRLSSTPDSAAAGSRIGGI